MEGNTTELVVESAIHPHASTGPLDAEGHVVLHGVMTPDNGSKPEPRCACSGAEGRSDKCAQCDLVDRLLLRRERARIQKKDYYLKNQDKLRAYTRTYYREHKEAVLEASRKYHQRKRFERRKSAKKPTVSTEQRQEIRREHARQAARIYRRERPEAAAAASRKYRLKKRDARLADQRTSSEALRHANGAAAKFRPMECQVQDAMPLGRA